MFCVFCVNWQARRDYCEISSVAITIFFASNFSDKLEWMHALTASTAFISLAKWRFFYSFFQQNSHPRSFVVLSMAHAPDIRKSIQNQRTIDILNISPAAPFQKGKFNLEICLHFGFDRNSNFALHLNTEQSAFDWNVETFFWNNWRNDKGVFCRRRNSVISCFSSRKKAEKTLQTNQRKNTFRSENNNCLTDTISEFMVFSHGSAWVESKVECLLFPTEKNEDSITKNVQHFIYNDA